MPTSPEQKAVGFLSVTEVLDYFQEPTLVDWKIKVGKKEARRISTIALKIGSRVHEIIENEWKEPKKVHLSSKDSIEVKNCMSAWYQFKNDYDPQILEMETELKDDSLGIIGHRDILLKIGDRIVTADLKTSARINPKHWLQVNKYAHMNNKYSYVGIIRLDKNLGIYQYEESEYGVTCVELFDSMVKLYWFFNPNGVKKEE